MSEIMKGLSFCAWFISFNIMISSSTHVVTNGRLTHPILWHPSNFIAKENEAKKSYLKKGYR